VANMRPTPQTVSWKSTRPVPTPNPPSPDTWSGKCPVSHLSPPRGRPRIGSERWSSSVLPANPTPATSVGLLPPATTIPRILRDGRWCEHVHHLMHCCCHLVGSVALHGPKYVPRWEGLLPDTEGPVAEGTRTGHPGLNYIHLPECASDEGEVMSKDYTSTNPNPRRGRTMDDIDITDTLLRAMYICVASFTAVYALLGG
jgi:hypothetical protein